MLLEEWKAIPNYPAYIISTKGRVFSCKSNKYLTPGESNTVEISNNDGRAIFTIQSLMSFTFLGEDIDNPFRKRIIFRDNDSTNLMLSNIEVEDTSDLPGEHWKPISNVNGHMMQDYYLVSNKGRVKSKQRVVAVHKGNKITYKHVPEMMCSCITADSGYVHVTLVDANKVAYSVLVHRLVASEFCENSDPNSKTVVNHIDGNKQNNCSDNLEWCTYLENSRHAVDTGLITKEMSKFTRYPVLHVETDTLYDSLSEASRAMGRWYGYVRECLKTDRRCTDKNGIEWHFIIFNNTNDEYYSKCLATELSYNVRKNNAISKGRNCR